MPGVDAKPEYHTVTATVVLIDPAQSLYYQACPDNNRKVCMHACLNLCSSPHL